MHNFLVEPPRIERIGIWLESPAQRLLDLVAVMSNVDPQSAELSIGSFPVRDTGHSLSFLGIGSDSGVVVTPCVREPPAPGHRREGGDRGALVAAGPAAQALWTTLDAAAQQPPGASPRTGGPAGSAEASLGPGGGGRQPRPYARAAAAAELPPQWGVGPRPANAGQGPHAEGGRRTRTHQTRTHQTRTHQTRTHQTRTLPTGTRHTRTRQTRTRQTRTRQTRTRQTRTLSSTLTGIATLRRAGLVRASLVRASLVCASLARASLGVRVWCVRVLSRASLARASLVRASLVRARFARGAAARPRPGRARPARGARPALRVPMGFGSLWTVFGGFLGGFCNPGTPGAAALEVFRLFSAVFGVFGKLLDGLFPGGSRRVPGGSPGPPSTRGGRPPRSPRTKSRGKLRWSSMFVGFRRRGFWTAFGLFGLPRGRGWVRLEILVGTRPGLGPGMIFDPRSKISRVLQKSRRNVSLFSAPWGPSTGSGTVKERPRGTNRSQGRCRDFHGPRTEEIRASDLGAIIRLLPPRVDRTPLSLVRPVATPIHIRPRADLLGQCWLNLEQCWLILSDLGGHLELSAAL